MLTFITPARAVALAAATAAMVLPVGPPTSSPTPGSGADVTIVVSSTPAARGSSRPLS